MISPSAISMGFAAAALCGGASAPQAQFSTPFVPELAAIDAALCVEPRQRSLASISIAQAAQDATPRKRGISPAAPAAARAVPAAGSAEGPR